MSDRVYANNMEISCKAASGKSACSFPDVCMTPPQTPATPPGVPIPYPNTGMASDTSEGSTSVQISGQEAMLKNKSSFKTSTGNEAGSAPMKGVVTHKNKGQVYFSAWSMDVLIEGENVVRNLDLMTHNHGSMPGNTGPWPYVSQAAAPATKKDCAEDVDRENTACGGKTAQQCCDDDVCQKARSCMLVPYGGSGSPNCCPGKTGHHLLPNSLLQGVRNDASSNVAGLATSGGSVYNCNAGACVCVAGGGHDGDHGAIHDQTRDRLRGVLQTGAPLSYGTAVSSVAAAHCAAVKGDDGKPQCKKECLEAQINESLKPYRTTDAEGKPNDIAVRRRDGITRMNFPESVNESPV